MKRRHGLTLIEVLLAVALLALLAGVVASVASDLRRASDTEPWQEDFDRLAMTADLVLEQVEMPLRVWPEGRVESVSLATGGEKILMSVRRIPCPDCSERIGLFGINAYGQEVHRFAPVASIPDEQAR